ncbi:hypothetical protein Cgig2_025563 [Carnegiea gigantea]|uniref:Uncharacterized protein n=1 Tax=Carnegiea gigantea TaxID=171969 RepID=A0A9Q1Q4D4_9CARY|nr:hypothetical protein Cgig2_025563 [Carnegiea gigantea]
MISTEYGSISSIVACEEDEQNAIAIDLHNCACYKCCAFSDIDVVDDGYVNDKVVFEDKDEKEADNDNDDDTNDEVEYNHKHAKGLWDVPFPFLDESGNIFCAGRSIEASCEDDVEDVDKLHNNNVAIDLGKAVEDKEENEYESVQLAQPSP